MAKEALNLRDAILRAAAAFDQGRLDEAESLSREILSVENDHFDATHVLAGVQVRRGLHLEALASFDRALALRPGHAEVLNNRGVALQELGRHVEALASHEQAIALQPNYAEAFHNRGNALNSLKRFNEALASHDRAISLLPNFPAAFNSCGIVLRELNRFEEALGCYNRALALRPDHVDAIGNRGNVLRLLKRYQEALADFDRSLALKPNNHLTHNNRGIVLKDLKRYAEALECYERALALQPDYAEAFSNRANVLKELNRPEEALENLDRALAIWPDFADAHNNRAVTLKELGRNDEVLAGYEKAIALVPDYAEAHLNRAMWLLLHGDFDRGWKGYEWRKKSPLLWSDNLNFTQPLWLGQENIAGKTILLYAEQGFGDTIQFNRYARLVAERGAQVILQVQPPLKRLLSGVTGVRVVLAQGEALPTFDYHCPLLSLPMAFGTRLATIPTLDPGVRALPELLAHWSTKLGPKTKPRVGLAWSGRPTHKNDRNRSIPLRSLLSLLQLPVQIVSLQQDVRAEDQNILRERQSEIIHFGPALSDFAETAALASLMDVVISVDTSVAHLAASLGRPTWIVLPRIPDWRWLLDREDTPWYPTARLFRQPPSGGWDEVVKRLVSELIKFASRPELTKDR